MAGTLTAGTVNATTVSLTTLTDGTISLTPATINSGSAKAWVAFSGADGSRYSYYNVGSVTKNGTGDYTVNFTNAFADGNYAVAFGNDTNSGAQWSAKCHLYSTSTNLTTSARMGCIYQNTGGAYDPAFVTATFFR